MMYSSGREFEKICLKILEHFFPIEQSEEMKTYDRCGFDMFIWPPRARTRFRAVYQCKTSQENFDSQHLKRCIESIRAFKKSAYLSDTYCFIFNKPLTNPDFRQKLTEPLEALRKQRQIKSFRIMDVDDFITYLTELIKDDLLKRIDNNGPLFYDRYQTDPGMKFYVEKIPFSVDKLKLYDPIEYLLQETTYRGTKKGGKNYFLLSEFGFGKTTLLLEFAKRVYLQQDGRKTIFIPITALEPGSFNNEGAMVRAIVAVLSPYMPATDIITRLNCEVMLGLLKENSTIVLLIDGLDEHKFFREFKGLRSLFNAVKGFSSPVVFSMRTEYYNERAADLKLALRGGKMVIKNLILTDWDKAEIMAFLGIFRKTNKLKSRREHGFKQLLRLVQEDKYKQKFGDIPRRPLFLKMILTDVIAENLMGGRITLFQLYEKYIKKKIIRDIEGVFPEFATSRGMDISKGLVDFSHDIFQMLERITIYMYFELNNRFVLSNSVSSDRIRELLVNTDFADTLVFSLHSVIIPAEEKYEMETHWKFAHFSFLEYFFARNIMYNLFGEEDYLN